MDRGNLVDPVVNRGAQAHRMMFEGRRQGRKMVRRQQAEHWRVPESRKKIGPEIRPRQRACMGAWNWMIAQPPHKEFKKHPHFDREMPTSWMEGVDDWLGGAVTRQQSHQATALQILDDARHRHQADGWLGRSQTVARPARQ
jgi:hypothetical protein